MDGTERLCRALYGRKPIVSDYLGGANAKMLHDAAGKLEMKEEKMFIGLMGIGDDGMLISPMGTRLFRLPLRMAMFVQRMQHWLASLTWK